MGCVESTDENIIFKKIDIERVKIRNSEDRINGLRGKLKQFKAKNRVELKNIIKILS